MCSPDSAKNYFFYKYKKNVSVFGSTTNKNYLTKNYININFPAINSRFYSTTKEYSKRIIIKLKKSHFDIIELHNRPVMVSDFVKKINSKIILYFHNDPRTMKGAKTVNDRIILLNSVDKIIFISKISCSFKSSFFPAPFHLFS